MTDRICCAGTVNAGPGARAADVLVVNGEAGDCLGRNVRAAIDAPIQISMDVPPAGPDPAPFVLYAWPGVPDATTVTPHPHHLGSMCFPTPLSGGAPLPLEVWNNIGKYPKLGGPGRPSVPAPSIVEHVVNGAGFAVAATLQGFILDDGSAADHPASVTNAVILTIE
jgi:hypothetical protein